VVMFDFKRTKHV